MLKVQIKSKENIKPSSPTSPNHPPIQLSSLDHISPPIYTHILLFYSSTTTIINPNHLKTSLSTTLLHFSPLAGRIHRSSSDGILYVHCTDEGAVFIEAEVHQAYNLQSFLKADHHAPIDEFPELLPIKKDHFNLLSAEEPLLAVQLTVFDSGGFVLGLSMCHLIADGASMALFLKQWSSISRSSGATIGLLPNFDSASLFSPQPCSASTVEKAQDDEHVHDEKKNTITITKVSIKRFVIDKEGIERLRVSKQGWRPTRVQAVCGLVWRCLRRAKLAGNHVSQVVNIRKKKTNMVSMLSEKDFGNLWVSVMVSTSDDQCEEEALREAVTSVNEEYVRNFIEGKVKKNDACWIFTSWCRMGFYESSDFGWGEPEWVGCGLREMKDVCMLIDSKDGMGVEVWVWLDEDGMEKLQNDLEFLSFVSF